VKGKDAGGHLPLPANAIMETVRFLDLECVALENGAVQLLVTKSVGPRIISLRFREGDNLFAELPDFVARRPDGKSYHFYGGHRLWSAPEDMLRTYQLDDQPVAIFPTRDGLIATQSIEPLTGIQKTVRVSLVGDEPRVIIEHTLTNRGDKEIECSPWAITQFKTGGVAILPYSQERAGALPNRSLALWPYTDLVVPRVQIGHSYILVHADMQKAFKVGFPNTRGWLAYWLRDALFVKRAPYLPQARYYDFGSSSECYCSDRFLELETLAPIATLPVGASATHTETWELYPHIESPIDEDVTRTIAMRLRLE
jgi:hypothetical protein